MQIIFGDFLQNMENCCSCLVRFAIHKQRAFSVAWFAGVVTGAGNLFSIQNNVISINLGNSISFSYRRIICKEYCLSMKLSLLPSVLNCSFDEKTEGKADVEKVNEKVFLPLGGMLGPLNLQTSALTALQLRYKITGISSCTFMKITFHKKIVMRKNGCNDRLCCPSRKGTECISVHVSAVSKGNLSI